MRLHLGVIVIEHDRGVPERVFQDDGDEAHPVLTEALLVSDEIRVACEEQDLTEREELDFDVDD